MQLAIDRQFQGVELMPVRLPPSALLVIRHLADPLPGRLGADPHSFRPPQAWTDAVQDRLDYLLAHAERPNSGGLSPAAQAVLFADEAEAVACLVLDLVRGQTGTCWWWKRIGVALPDVAAASDGAVSGVAVAQVLVAHAREIPAIFASLLQWRAAVEVVAALDQGRTRALLQAVAVAYRLDLGVIAPAGHAHREPSTDSVSTDATFASTSEAMPAVPHRLAEPDTIAEPDIEAVASHPIERHGPEEPWFPWLPPQTMLVPLAPEQRCLLGLALALQAAPTLVRQSVFTHRARQWWHHQERSGWLARWQDRDHMPLADRGYPDRGVEKNSDSPVSSPKKAVDLTSHTESKSPTSLGEGGDPHNIMLASGETPTGRTSAEVDHRETNARERWPRTAPPEDVLPGHREIPVDPLSLEAVLWEPDEPERAFSASYPDEHSGPDEPRVQEPPIIAGIRSVDVPLDDVPMVDTGGNRSAPPGIDHSAGATDATTPDRNEPTEPQTQTGRSSPIDFAGEQFHTRIGGILYLIHALEDLDIPTAFENGWRLATRLGPWGSLDLIARALLGERLGDVADDATWAVLAMLRSSRA